MAISELFSTIRGRWRTILVAAVVIPLLLLSFYTWLALHWDYSEGNRSGTLQKFSRKGWLCKTYEGELWQSVVTNVAPTIWFFTVREDGVARSLDTMVGRTVRVHYTEHRGIRPTVSVIRRTTWTRCRG